MRGLRGRPAPRGCPWRQVGRRRPAARARTRGLAGDSPNSLEIRSNHEKRPTETRRNQLLVAAPSYLSTAPPWRCGTEQDFNASVELEGRISPFSIRRPIHTLPSKPL